MIAMTVEEVALSMVFLAVTEKKGKRWHVVNVMVLEKKLGHYGVKIFGGLKNSNEEWN